MAGREDNEHLIELLAELSDDPEQLPQRLYAGLGGTLRHGLIYAAYSDDLATALAAGFDRHLSVCAA